MNKLTIPTPSQLWQSDAGQGGTIPGTLTADGLIHVPGEPAVAPVAPPAHQGRTFTEEDIERARQQEKDKMYGRVTAAEAASADRQKQLDEIAARETVAATQAEEARKRAAEAEMDAKTLIASKEQEWAAQIAAVRQENEQTRAMLDMERRFAQLNDYRAARLVEEGDEIIPQLRDLVSGDSEEAIDNAIAILKERSAAIVADVQAAQQVSAPLAPVQQRGVGITAPPVGPMENQSEQRTLTAEQLRNMDMNEYAKVRQRILPSSATKSQGIFGR